MISLYILVFVPHFLCIWHFYVTIAYRQALIRVGRGSTCPSKLWWERLWSRFILKVESIGLERKDSSFHQRRQNFLVSYYAGLIMF